MLALRRYSSAALHHFNMHGTPSAAHLEALSSNFSYFPNVLSHSECSQLFNACLLRLDRMDTHATRRRRRKALEEARTTRPVSAQLQITDKGVEGGIVQLDEELYDFQEVRSYTTAACSLGSQF